MTQWLPIETYPYDFTWGLFRGGEMGQEQIHRNRGGNPDYKMICGPAVVGASNGKTDDGAHAIRVSITDNDQAWYLNPTEWMPLDIVIDAIEPHHVTAARIML